MFKEIPKACFLPAHFQEDALLTPCRGSTGDLIKLWAPSFTATPALKGACLSRAHHRPCAALLPSFSLQRSGVCTRKVKSRVHLYITQKSRSYVHVHSQQTANVTFRRNISNESEIKTCQNPLHPAHQGVIEAIPFLLPIAHEGMADSQHIHQRLTPQMFTSGQNEATFSRLKEKTFSLNPERSPPIQFSI